mmetsp:Transcript_14849/g.23472  ORF Transcript_14849/g.23472 Transcript_14849/m.23472 type:complete len:850 (+) Transcript_14849:103-2652(+)
MSSHTSPSPWAGTRALFPTVPEASATTVRRAGAFLRTRCGSLEEAFRALDPSSTGNLTLETFARGMEKLGYESSLAETTQVFQAMDTGFRGSVGLASFLMAFNDNADDSRLSLQSARAVASSLTAASDCIARSVNSSCPSVMDSTDREVDMGGQARRLVEEMLEDKIACSAMRLEGSFQADMAHLREQIADCERSAKAESVRLSERIEAKCMDAWSAAVEELNGKIESLRQKLRDAELASAQQQLEVCAVGNRIDSNNSESRGQLRMLHSDFNEKVELMQSSMDGTLQAFRAEMREWLDEERAASNERTQALGRALTEEFQHSIVEQVTASARTEACAVTCQVVAKEFETWQKEGGAVQSDLVQVGERLSKLEKRLPGAGIESAEKMFDVHLGERLSKLEKRLLSLDSAEANAARKSEADGNSSEKSLDDEKNPARLEGMLLSILEKLDNKCLDSFATDMKELSTLLEDPRLKAGSIRDLGPKLQENDSTAYAASTTSDPSVAEISSASKGQDAADRSSVETSKGMGIQKLREDIFGYLRSEFQDVVSQTIAGLNTQERSPGSLNVPVAGKERSPGSLILPIKEGELKLLRSPETRHRELSRPKQGLKEAAAGVQRRPGHSPISSPAVGFRQLDQRVGLGSAPAVQRRESGSVPVHCGSRTPLRLDSRAPQVRGSNSPPPPKASSTNSSAHGSSINSRPSSQVPNGIDRGAVTQGSHGTPLTPTAGQQGCLVPTFGGHASVELPRSVLESHRTDPERGGATQPQALQAGQMRPSAQDHKRGSGNQQAFGLVQGTPAPEEFRSAAAVQAMQQRASMGLEGAKRALSEATARVPQQSLARTRMGSMEPAVK